MGTARDDPLAREPGLWLYRGTNPTSFNGYDAFFRTEGELRFVLFQSNYEVGGATKVFEEKAVFEIDRTTGATWLFVSGYDSQHELKLRWVPIED